MTRKEQILNEAIDYSFVEENFLEYDDYGNVCDDRDFIQRAFEEGAKWADKTMIENACKWLETALMEASDNSYIYCDCTNSVKEFIQTFRNTLE